MESCEICGIEVEGRNKVCCSGACGKMVHATCLMSTQDHFTEWMCSPDCRKLPNKVLRTILENFDRAQLANARLVCHHWKRLIDRSTSLVDKLVLRFPPGITLDKNCEAVRDLVSSTLRHTRACLKKVTIVGAASWWPEIGYRLNTLIVKDCKMSLDILLDMLKATVGLKQLMLNCGNNFLCHTIPTINYKLYSLEELFLDGIQRVEILDVFGQLCPRVRSLSIPGRCKLEGYNRLLLCFIKRTRRTLEEVEINGDNDLFDKLTDMSGLLLRRVSLANIDQEMLQYLSGQCPTLEAITVTRTKVNNQTLLHIGDNLPMLESLTVRIATVVPEVTFMNWMPHLEYLSLRCSNHMISFEKLDRHQLTSLTLIEAKQKGNWFQHLPNLRFVTLEKCSIAGGWSFLFVPVAQLRKLQYLRLDQVSVENDSEEVEYLPDYLDSLTVLVVQRCTLLKDSLRMLLKYCTKLVKIWLDGVTGVDDDIGKDIGRNGEYLQEVSVRNCAIHDLVFLKHVKKHRREVVLHLNDNVQEAEDAKGHEEVEGGKEIEDSVGDK